MNFRSVTRYAVDRTRLLGPPASCRRASAMRQHAGRIPAIPESQSRQASAKSSAQIPRIAQFAIDAVTGNVRWKMAHARLSRRYDSTCAPATFGSDTPLASALFWRKSLAIASPYSELLRV